MCFGPNHKILNKLRRLTYVKWWTYFLIFLKICNTLSLTLIFGMYHWYLNCSLELTVLYIATTRTLFWISDLLTITSLAYLFYVQSMHVLHPKVADPTIDGVMNELRDKVDRGGGNARCPNYNTLDI